MKFVSEMGCVLVGCLVATTGCGKKEPPALPPAVVSKDKPDPPKIDPDPIKPAPKVEDDTGAVSFETALKDPKTIVLIDSSEHRLADLDKDFKLKVGTHRLEVKLGPRTLQRRDFTLAKGQRVIIELFETERRAAEWALEHGGLVDISLGGKTVPIAKDGKSAGLPDEMFRVVGINLIDKQSVTSLDPLRGLEAIEQLNLDRTKIDEAALINLKGLKTLKHVSLAGPNLTDAGVANLKELTALERLNIAGAALTDETLGNLVALTKLKVLDVRNAKITDAGLARLKALPNLRELMVQKTAITGSGLAQLQGLPLEKLGIGDTPGVGDDCIKHLHAFKKLTWLRLSFTKVTDEGVRGLKGLQLGTLGLEGNAISDASIASLKDMTSLKYLNVARTTITDASLPHLKALPNLKDLILNGTKLTDAGKDELQKALPKANIRR